MLKEQRRKSLSRFNALRGDFEQAGFCINLSLSDKARLAHVRRQVWPKSELVSA